MKDKITIIGAGLTGCFLAILFAKKGYTVTVYEKFLEDEIGANTSKRSITLTMYGYGVDTLARIGLWDSLAHLFLRLEGSITQIGNSKYLKPIITLMDQVPFYAIPRAGLLEGLLKQGKQYKSITFYFGKNLIGINRKTKQIRIQDVQSKKIINVACDVIFGADGIHSKVRDFLQKGQMKKLNIEYTNWTYKQVILKKETARRAKLQGNFSQNWTRKNAIFVAYPHETGIYNGMFILPQNKKNGFSSLKTEDSIRLFIEKYFPDFIPALSDITPAFLHNPEGHFVTIETYPWYYKDFLVILGDAAHGFPPFYGQGVSAAFADSMEIIRLHEKYGEDWKKIFSEYQNVQKKNTDVLAFLSKQTLQTYRREKRADYGAIYAKLESLLHSFFPHLFSSPPFLLVASDQTHAAEHFAKHMRQRKFAKYVGIPFVAAIITGIVAIHETFGHWYKNLNREYLLDEKPTHAL